MSITLRLYTDFICPFCFIAEESTVPRLLQEFDLDLDWHGFELHPSSPPGGTPLSQLFPGVDLAMLHARTQRFAAQFGVTDFSPPNWLRNSRRAMTLAEYAREQGLLEPFRHAAFQAHWREGKNLEDETDLKAVSERAGLEPDAALAALAAPTYLERVNQKQAQAKAAGVTGVPTFVLGNQRVVGCQPYEVLATAARAAGVARRAHQP